MAKTRKKAERGSDHGPRARDVLEHRRLDRGEHCLQHADVGFEPGKRRARPVGFGAEDLRVGPGGGSGPG